MRNIHLLSFEKLVSIILETVEMTVKDIVKWSKMSCPFRVNGCVSCTLTIHCVSSHDK